ncbi:MAG: prepilin-type N-terminal cleavage/methylation domain-containing protein [Alphaproteobacteria bacterium]|nr:prepilin-type N-terminal cleavage/methylation domain-containing protein [Alphaproteobacteria bacterium]
MFARSARHPLERAVRGGRRKPVADGFTLLEIVVALAIAGFFVIGLFHAGSGGLLAVDIAGRTEEAVERAQSHLAALGRNAALMPGDLDGEDGGGFRWRLQVRPLLSRPADTAAGTAGSSLFDVEVTISWTAGGREHSVALKTLRLGSGSAPE